MELLLQKSVAKRGYYFDTRIKPSPASFALSLPAVQGSHQALGISHPAYKRYGLANTWQTGTRWWERNNKGLWRAASIVRFAYLWRCFYASLVGYCDLSCFSRRLLFVNLIVKFFSDQQRLYLDPCFLVGVNCRRLQNLQSLPNSYFPQKKSTGM